MSFIRNTTNIFTGGNNFVECLELKNGKILCLNEDEVSLFNDMEEVEKAILGDEPDLSINGFRF